LAGVAAGVAGAQPNDRGRGRGHEDNAATFNAAVQRVAALRAGLH